MLLALMLTAGTYTNVYAKGSAKAKTVSAKKDSSYGKIRHLTKAEFNKRISNTDGTWNYIGDKPCVIDFFATWCGPCKMITPYLEDFAEKYKDQLYVYKVDVDQEKELAQMFCAYSIPLLIFVPQYGSPTSQRGALSKDDLEQAIRTQVLGLPK